MAANRKKSNSGARRQRGGRGAGLKILSYLGVAALGAVVALAATGRVPLPDWPQALVAQVQQMARGEEAPVARSAPQASAEPRKRTPVERQPDVSIRTSALPVARPPIPVPAQRPETKPLPVVVRPPAELTPKTAEPRVPERTTHLSGLTFPICGEGPSRNCIIDGDTFVIAGKAIRVADIDTPESGNPKCLREAELAKRATKRLQQLLNAGPVDLIAIARDEDIYGRKLRTVTRAGRSLGDTLIAEGLARRWTGAKSSWCA